jgi:hypothetical protein
MTNRVFRSITEPIREGLSFEERWRGADRGLITAWEVGRRGRNAHPEVAKRASKGELPVSGWKGGVDKKLKKKHKFGTLTYLAEWQGLRGEDLDIGLDDEVTLTCSRTGMSVTYTSDSKKYAEP